MRRSSTQECPPSGQAFKRLIGGSADAPTNFLANAGIVLRHLESGMVSRRRQAVGGTRLFQRANGLVQDALPIGGGRRRHPLLIVLLESDHARDGGCCRVELLV